MSTDSSRGRIVSAIRYATNPVSVIGVIAIVTYPAFCSLLKAVHSNLSGNLQAIAILAACIFPLAVTLIILHLILKHPRRLYSPQDFRDDEGFMRYSFDAGDRTSSDPRDWSSLKLEEIADRDFRDEVVCLDGKKFLRCRFDGTKLVFRGQGPVQLMDSNLRNINLDLQDNASLTMQFLIAWIKNSGPENDHAFLDLIEKSIGRELHVRRSAGGSIDASGSGV